MYRRIAGFIWKDYAILYKGLKHLRDLISKGVLKPIPWGYQERAYMQIVALAFGQRDGGEIKKDVGIC